MTVRIACCQISPDVGDPAASAAAASRAIAAAVDEGAQIVETKYGRIGLAICYDIEFPELTRGLALRGADLLALPANWPHDPSPPDGRPVLHSLAAMTAYWNRVFVAVCDRCGSERGCEF